MQIAMPCRVAQSTDRKSSIELHDATLRLRGQDGLSRRKWATDTHMNRSVTIAHRSPIRTTFSTRDERRRRIRELLTGSSRSFTYRVAAIRLLLRTQPMAKIAALRKPGRSPRWQIDPSHFTDLLLDNSFQGIEGGASSGPKMCAGGQSVGESKIATARVHPAEAAVISTGKHEISKPV